MLDELTGTGVNARWWPMVYEPETAAIGGPTAMDTVHDLFCADSVGVLDYLRQDAPGLGRRELSVLLLSGLLRAAGLDTFKCGDVSARNGGECSGPGPAEDGEGLAGAVGVDAGGRVVDQVGGKVVEGEPVDRGAFVGLAVCWGPCPVGGEEEQPEAGLHT